MPKVKYSQSKGLTQAAGSGFLPLGETTVPMGLGAMRSQVFRVDLTAITGAVTQFADGDVLKEIGSLNVDTVPGVTATKIIVSRVIVNVTDAAGQALAGFLSLSSTSGTAENAAHGGTEIAGAGATHQSGDTAADFNFNSASAQAQNPLSVAAIANRHLYVATTTTLNALLADGKANILIEYFVI